ANVVERSRPDPRGVRSDQTLEPSDHLPRCAAGERDEQDRLGGDPLGDQVRHAVGDDAGLARAGSGQDQVVAVGGRGRGALRLVQIARKPLRQPLVGGLLELNLPHGVPAPADWRSLPRGQIRIIRCPFRRETGHPTSPRMSTMASVNTDPELKIIRSPRVYLVGRQMVDDAALSAFLSDHNVQHWATDTEEAGEKLIEVAGRVCYMSFARPRPGGNKAYISHLLEVGHGSVLEHAVFNLIIT